MKRKQVLMVLAGLVALPAYATGSITAKQSQAMKQLLATYAKKAETETDRRKDAPKLEFSADTGRAFYLKPRAWQERDRTCSSCHTEDPTKEGKHIETKKPIKPLAPAANPERFTDAAKVEKNFSEHCTDLYERDCRAVEKGNFIAFLMSVK